MKRRLIKQGHGTMTITLPIEWVRRFHLNDGDEVDVTENDTSLCIHPHPQEVTRSISIDVSNLTVPMVWRFFQSAYREGYNEIRVVFDPRKKKYQSVYHYYTTQFAYTKLGEKPPPKPAVDMIQELVNRFIGIEVVEVKENYVLIKEMGESSAKEYESSLRRIFSIIENLFDRVIAAIKNNEVGNVSICKELHTMDLNTDRFIDYCCRILNKVNDSAPLKKKPTIFASLFILELLGDEFKYVGAHLAKTKKKVDVLLPFVEKVRLHFQLYEKLFFRFDKELAATFGRNDFLIYAEHEKWKDRMTHDIRSIEGHFMLISKFLFCLGELKIEMES